MLETTWRWITSARRNREQRCLKRTKRSSSDKTSLSLTYSKRTRFVRLQSLKLKKRCLRGTTSARLFKFVWKISKTTERHFHRTFRLWMARFSTIAPTLTTKLKKSRSAWRSKKLSRSASPKRLRRWQVDVASDQETPTLPSSQPWLKNKLAADRSRTVNGEECRIVWNSDAQTTICLTRQ